MSLWHAIRYGTFAHDLHRGRDKDGRAIDQCVLCSFTRLVLAEDVIIGPAHHQKKDWGAVTTEARKVIPVDSGSSAESRVGFLRCARGGRERYRN